MKEKIYYKIVSIIAVIEFLSFLIGNVTGYIDYGFDFIVSVFVFNLIAYGLVIFLAYKKSLGATILMIILNGYTYWSSYNWGVTGFSLQNAKLQPLIVVWLALFSMVYCLIGTILVHKNNGVKK